MRGCSWGGHAWLLGGMCGCVGGCAWLLGGVRGCSGGGHAWLLGGACVVAPGGCVVAPGGHAWLLLGEGVHGFSQGGHAWLLPGGMRGFFDEIRSMSGRYTSYWNAFLLGMNHCDLLGMTFYDLLGMNNCVNYLVNNVLYCTNSVHSHLLFG